MVRQGTSVCKLSAILVYISSTNYKWKKEINHEFIKISHHFKSYEIIFLKKSYVDVCNQLQNV